MFPQITAKNAIEVFRAVISTKHLNLNMKLGEYYLKEFFENMGSA